MMDVYSDSAYRSNRIPTLPPGGHRDKDRAFSRLPWGHYQTPVVPNTMVAQLSYSRLFKDEKDADDGFPWGETFFSVGKGFLSWLQGSLYMLYLGSALVFFVSLLGLAAGILGILLNNPTTQDFWFLGKIILYYFGPVAIGFFGGKYGRRLLAYFTETRQRADPTGLYRREGLVRIRQKDGVFEAPFIEFDAYLIHSPSGRGGRYYNLLLQHRYSNTRLWMKGLVTDAMNPLDVHAYWDMIQQYMDVSQPLPDVPIFEPFRSRDPVTRAADERSGRDPFYWRKVSKEEWRDQHEAVYRKRLQNANFHHPCILDAHIQARGLPLPGEPGGAMLA